MSSSVPQFRQESPNTCALACLRMVLAAFGTSVDEATLVRQATMTPTGTDILEVERLGRAYGLIAEVRRATVEELQELLDAGCLAIVYLNRRILNARNIRSARRSIQEALIHCVVPTRFTAQFVTYHDPLADPPQRRSIARFAGAHAHLDSPCVVCRKPDDGEDQLV